MADTWLRMLGVALALVFGGFAANAQNSDPDDAAADLAAGERVYGQCATCHSLEPGKNKQGPHLANLWGRKAGSVEGFRYSKAMMQSAIVWDDETLTEFLLNPREAIPGTTMLIGVRREADVVNLLGFLREATSEGD